MKLAAIEAEWHTEPAPAGFNLIAFPDQEKGENSFEIKIPFALAELPPAQSRNKLQALMI